MNVQTSDLILHFKERFLIVTYRIDIDYKVAERGTWLIHFEFAQWCSSDGGKSESRLNRLRYFLMRMQIPKKRGRKTMPTFRSNSQDTLERFRTIFFSSESNDVLVAISDHTCMINIADVYA